MPKRSFFINFVSVLIALALAGSASGQQPSLKITEPPSPLVAATYSEGNYKIHIYQNGDVKSVPAAERSVLVLGTFSDADAVLNSRNYINPSTGKRFDVIIGLGADSLGAELKRVILTDHFNADQNAAALASAINKQFGGPLAAGTVYTHSNGTTVGIAATLAGTFSGVRQMNMMGPDIGYGGTYLNRESLAKLKSQGVEGVSIFRNRGDIVPTLGEITKMLGDSLPGSVLASQTVKSLQALRDIASAPKEAGLPAVNEYEIRNNFGNPVANRFAENYLNSIAGFINDGGFVSTPKSEPLDAKGVRIYIDDEILTEALVAGTASDNQALFSELASHLADATDATRNENYLAAFGDTLKTRLKNTRATASLDKVVVVSLRRLLEDSTPFVDKWSELPDGLRHPGGITRINGYFLDPGKDDVLLIGSVTAGDARIDIDDLTVGLRAAWKDDTVPFCSLDPDAENISGPQKVCVAGVPGDSGFALTMLDADYSMKKIMFGIDKVDVSGFRSHADILRSDAEMRPITNRFWLYPVQPQAGVVEVSSDMSSALFMGGVQVLSEEMEQTQNGFTGTGTVDPGAGEAAGLFTRYYSQIRTGRPEFQRLEGLFDIVLTARILRQANIKSVLLDKFIELPYKRVSIPTSYDGLSVDMGISNGVSYRLSGGVQAKTTTGRRSLLELDDPHLSSIRKAADAWSGDRPAMAITNASLQVTQPDLTHRDTINLSVASAMTLLSNGNISGAKDILNKSISAHPFDAEQLAYRAYVDFLSGDVPSARSDALAAERMDSDNSIVTNVTSVVLFQCDLLDGHPDKALQQIDWAIRNDPASVRSSILRATVLVVVGQPDEARKELLKATQMDPTSALALAKLGMLEMSEGWTTKGQKLIARAWIMAKALHQDGPEVMVTLAFAEMVAAGSGNVKSQLAKAEKIAKDVLALRACDPETALQAHIVLTVAAMGNDDWDGVDAYILEASKLVLGAPDIFLFAAEGGMDAKRPDLAQKYLASAERIAPQNPAVKALRQKLGR